MNRNEYEALLATAGQAEPAVTVDDLVDWTERTLLYGYTADPESFHVYLSGGLITVHIYGGTRENPQTIYRHSATTWPVGKLYPNKRVYPEYTDFRFVKLLRERGAELSLHRFDEDRAAYVSGLTFHGAL